MKSGFQLVSPSWSQNSSLLPQNCQNIGKWSEQEKKTFNSTYLLFDSMSDKYIAMSKYIPTRTPCQIRSHWQKVMEKNQRDSQKIGKNPLPQDLLQVSSLSLQQMKVRFFGIKLSSFVEDTKVFQLFCIDKCSQIEFSENTLLCYRYVEDESRLGYKIVQNVLIRAPISSFSLQKQGKIQQEQRTMTYFEEIQREKLIYDKKDFIYYKEYEKGKNSNF